MLSPVAPLLVITDSSLGVIGFIRPPEITDTKWGKRYRIALEFEDHDKRRWSINDTTFWNLSHDFGANGSEWVGKLIELKLKRFRVEGKNVTGIVGMPIK